MPGLKIIFGQQIYLKWDDYILLIVVLIFIVCDRFFHQICSGQTFER